MPHGEYPFHFFSNILGPTEITKICFSYLHSTVVKSEPLEVKAPEPSPTIIPDDVSNVIKIEHTDASDNDDDDKQSEVDDLDRNKLFPTIENRPNDASIATRIALLNASTAAALVQDDAKYCHGCDIKFSSHSTFLAHKRYYCKNVQNDFDGTSAATRSSPNQTSVVT